MKIASQNIAKVLVAAALLCGVLVVDSGSVLGQAADIDVSTTGKIFPVESVSGIGRTDRIQIFESGIPVADQYRIERTGVALTGYFPKKEVFDDNQQFPAVHTKNLINPVSQIPVNFLLTDSILLVWKNIEHHWRLCYQMNGSFKGTLEQIAVFTDAYTGKQVLKEDRFCMLNVTGSAHTEYYGTQPIGTFFTGSNYILKNDSLGNGIETLDLQHQTSYSGTVSYTDADNIWNHNEVNPVHHAADAHYCAEKYALFLLSNFNRNSLNNAGVKLTSYLNYGTSFANAFWNGNAVVYGSGNTLSGPMTTLDIAGHEFTHGLIQYMTGLNYSGESGIINEAIADMTGTAFEMAADSSNFDWLIGEDTGSPIRSMQQPELYNQPAYYHGTHWYFGSGDNGGVHINSGFLNKWFYLLAAGDSGINEEGTFYNVNGIGIFNAIQLVYATMQLWVTPTTGFESFRDYTIATAVLKFGQCSPEQTAVEAAWKAVGLYPQQKISLTVNGPTSRCEGDTVLTSLTCLPYSTIQWFKNNLPIAGATNMLPVSETGYYNAVISHCGMQFYTDTLFVEFLPKPLLAPFTIDGCAGVPINLQKMYPQGVFSVSSPYSGGSVNATYTLYNASGCKSLVNVPINIHPVPVANLTAIADSIQLPVSSYLLNAVPASGTWSGQFVEGNHFLADRAGPGNFSLTYTLISSYGCENSISKTISVLPICEQPENGFISGTSDSVKKGGILNFSLSGLIDTSGYTYQWRVPYGVTIIGSSQASQLKASWTSADGFISCIVRSKCGSETEVTKKFEVLSETQLTSVFPNPAYGTIYVKLSATETSGSTIQLFTLDGKLAYEVPAAGIELQQIDLNQLPAGVYILVLSSQPYVRKKIELFPGN
ncbi:MAG TPA: M4 family metallopeptidase [Bacteroidia bacterium]|nr:M4 family metallopeptidase [Bacteroidia bacterium]